MSHWCGREPAPPHLVNPVGSQSPVLPSSDARHDVTQGSSLGAARFACDPREFTTATGVRLQVLSGGSDTSGA